MQRKAGTQVSALAALTTGLGAGAGQALLALRTRPRLTAVAVVDGPGIACRCCSGQVFELRRTPAPMAAAAAEVRAAGVGASLSQRWVLLTGLQWVAGCCWNFWNRAANCVSGGEIELGFELGAGGWWKAGCRRGVRRSLTWAAVARCPARVPRARREGGRQRCEHGHGRGGDEQGEARRRHGHLGGEGHGSRGGPSSAQSTAGKSWKAAT